MKLLYSFKLNQKKSNNNDLDERKWFKPMNLFYL